MEQIKYSSPPPKEESSNNDDDDSFAEYILRIPSPTPSLKREASVALEDSTSEPRGAKRSKVATEEALQALRSTVLYLPSDLTTVRQSVFSLDREIKWSAEWDKHIRITIGSK